MKVFIYIRISRSKNFSRAFLIQRIGQLAEDSNAWLKLERQGKIHGQVITNGANTGRCTHQKPNVAQTPSVGVPYGMNGSLFTVPDGFNLVGCDVSGLELRCLALYHLGAFDGGSFAKQY